MTDQKELTVPVLGMTCANCVAAVERNAKKVDGVDGAVVNFASEKLHISYDPALAEQIASIAAGIVGKENVVRTERTMGSEDMSYLMDEIPGCYFFIGSANKARDLAYPHHNPRFDIDEEALLIGTKLLAKAAASFVIPE